MSLDFVKDTPNINQVNYVGATLKRRGVIDIRSVSAQGKKFMNRLSCCLGTTRLGVQDRWSRVETSASGLTAYIFLQKNSVGPGCVGHGSWSHESDSVDSRVGFQNQS